jgi:hypothetical protein
MSDYEFDPSLESGNLWRDVAARPQFYTDLIISQIRDCLQNRQPLVASFNNVQGHSLDIGHAFGFFPNEQLHQVIAQTGALITQHGLDPNLRDIHLPSSTPSINWQLALPETRTFPSAKTPPPQP